MVLQHVYKALNPATIVSTQNKFLFVVNSKNYERIGWS